MGVSQTIASPNVATAIGFVVMILFSVVSMLAEWVSRQPWQEILNALDLLVPGGHKMDLWLPDAMHAGTATVFLLALGAAYMLAGYARFSRRNL